jgi:hypothetical protein
MPIKRHKPRFCITFHIKDAPLATKLLNIIEYGHIVYKPKNNPCVLTVSAVKGLFLGLLMQMVVFLYNILK